MTPTTNEALYQLIGRFDEFDRKMDERHRLLVAELRDQDERIEALESAPARRREKLHTYAVAAMSGVGAIIVSHFRFA